MLIVLLPFVLVSGIVIQSRWQEMQSNQMRSPTSPVASQIDEEHVIPSVTEALKYRTTSPVASQIDDLLTEALKHRTTSPVASQIDEEHLVRYEGKARPYRITLLPAWRESAPPNSAMDRFFIHFAGPTLGVRVYPQVRDYSDWPDDFVKGLREARSEPGGKNRYDRVRLDEHGKLQIRGTAWKYAKIQVQLGGKTTWLSVAVYSGLEGAYVLYAEAETDDSATHDRLLKAFDSFELPQPAPPTAFVRKAFSFSYPASWFVDEKDKDYDPDHIVSIYASRDSQITFVIIDAVKDPVDALATAHQGFKQHMLDAESTELKRWGNYDVAGTALGGKFQGKVKSTIRIFLFNANGKTFMITAQMADDERLRVAPGFGIIEKSFRATSEQGPTPPPASQAVTSGPTEQRSDEEQPVRHEGKARPYHITLTPAWEETAPTNPLTDRFFKHTAGLTLAIRVYAEGTDLTEWPAHLAKAFSEARSEPGNKKKFDRVHLAEQGKLEIHGTEWTYVKVETQVGGVTAWTQSRAHSGPDGAYVLATGAESDDPATRAVLRKALDSFEFPQPTAPKVLVRKSFRFNYPVSWALDEKAKDYDPDHLFSIDASEGSMIMFIIIDTIKDPVDALATYIQGFRQHMLDAESTELKRWGEYDGAGAVLKGKIQGVVKSAIRIFVFNANGKTFVITEQMLDGESLRLAPEFRVIESSFRATK